MVAAMCIEMMRGEIWKFLTTRYSIICWRVGSGDRKQFGDDFRIDDLGCAAASHLFTRMRLSTYGRSTTLLQGESVIWKEKSMR